MAKDPVTHVLTPQEYLQKVEAGTMPPMNNHQMMKEMAEKRDCERSDQVSDDGVSRYQPSDTAQTPQPQKHK